MLCARSADSTSRPSRGQGQIEQHQVEGFSSGSIEGALAGSFDRHLVLLRLKPLAQRVGDLRFILDDQHFHCAEV